MHKARKRAPTRQHVCAIVIPPPLEASSPPLNSEQTTPTSPSALLTQSTSSRTREAPWRSGQNTATCCKIAQLRLWRRTLKNKSRHDWCRRRSSNGPPTARIPEGSAPAASTPQQPKNGGNTTDTPKKKRLLHYWNQLLCHLPALCRLLADGKEALCHQLPESRRQRTGWWQRKPLPSACSLPSASWRQRIFAVR